MAYLAFCAESLCYKELINLVSAMHEGGGGICVIPVPRGHDPFAQHQNSALLARPDFLGMRRVFNRICQT